jgi:hypothetical protein
LIDDPSEIEQAVHSSLSHCRVNQGREFFRIDIDTAISAINLIINKKGKSILYHTNNVSNNLNIRADENELCLAAQWDGNPATALNFAGYSFLCVPEDYSVIESSASINELEIRTHRNLAIHLLGPLSSAGIAALRASQFFGLHGETDNDINILEGNLRTYCEQIRFARVSIDCLTAFKDARRPIECIYLHEIENRKSTRDLSIEVPKCLR